MNKELLESGYGTENAQELENYQHYLKLGGIINEKDYSNAMDRAATTTTADRITAGQVEVMSDFAGIKLHNLENSVDPKIILYGILRDDVRPEGVKYHHDQMSDQQIFVEALRMLGDKESVDKMIKAHPHMNFDYKRGRDN